MQMIQISWTVAATASTTALVTALSFGYVSRLGAAQDQGAPAPNRESALRMMLEQRQGVLSGPDFGFRIDPKAQARGGSPVGQLVVRVNGQWVEAQLAVGYKVLTQRLGE